MEDMDVVGIEGERKEKLVEAERKNDDQDGKRKLGRLRKMEKLRKEKRGSTGCMDEMKDSRGICKGRSRRLGTGNE